MNISQILVAGLMVIVAGWGEADSLPVINTVSIEINGIQYKPGDTAVVNTATVDFRIHVPPYSLNRTKITYDATYPYLCNTDPVTCIGSHPIRAAGTTPRVSWGSDGNGNGTTANPVSLNIQPGTTTYQVVFAGDETVFLGFPGRAEEPYATGGNITIQYVIPGKQTLTVNGNALANSDAIPASTNQSVSVSVTVSSADNGMAGQVYVAAVLPKDPTIYMLTSAKKWVPWNGKAFSPYFVGTLSAQSVDVGTLDLTTAKGAQIFVGYGVGTGDAADKDLLTGKYSSWAVK